MYLCIIMYYIKLNSHLSVCQSVCTFWNGHNSLMFVLIKTELARNKSYVFQDCKVYFYKSTGPTIYQQECIKEDDVSTKQPLPHEALSVNYLASGLSPTLHVLLF